MPICTKTVHSNTTVKIQHAVDVTNTALVCHYNYMAGNYRYTRIFTITFRVKLFPCTAFIKKPVPRWVATQAFSVTVPLFYCYSTHFPRVKADPHWRSTSTAVGKLQHVFVTIVTIRSPLALAQLTPWNYSIGSLSPVLSCS